MGKRIVPYARCFAGEIFVRMRAEGSVHGRLCRDAPVMVRVVGMPHSLKDGRVIQGEVRECDVVAMVLDDEKYAFADAAARAEPYNHARGPGMKFATPADAARHLASLGWTVTPPPVRHRSHLEVTAGGKTASLTLTSESGFADAHVEPIGEPRFYVRPVPRFSGREAYEVLDRERSHDDPARWRAAGPFTSRHLAQAEADDLNNGDTK